MIIEKDDVFDEIICTRYTARHIMTKETDILQQDTKDTYVAHSTLAVGNYLSFHQ